MKKKGDAKPPKEMITDEAHHYQRGYIAGIERGKDQLKQAIKEAIEGELADAREELHGATGSHDIAEIESRIITLKKVIKLLNTVTPK